MRRHHHKLAHSSPTVAGSISSLAIRPAHPSVLQQTPIRHNMSEGIIPVSGTPARTLSKSSERRSLFSSSGNSAPPSPPNDSTAFPPLVNPSDPTDHIQEMNSSSSPALQPDTRRPTDSDNSDDPSSSSSHTNDNAIYAQIPGSIDNNSNNANAVSNLHADLTVLENSGNEPQSSADTHAAPPHPPSRRSSFGLGFLSTISNTIRGTSHSNAALHNQPSSSSSSSNGATTTSPPPLAQHAFMSNSPTMNNLSHVSESIDDTFPRDDPLAPRTSPTGAEATTPGAPERPLLASEPTAVRPPPAIAESAENQEDTSSQENTTGKDKDGFFSVRLTPIIDHLSSNTGLYFSPMIRRVQPKRSIFIGRYTEKNKSAAHAPQGSSAPIVFKSKVVSRTHAMFECNEEGLWFLKDCKSSSGTFLNNIRLSQASQELTLWPLIDGDIVQLGLDYRGGTEEVYRCVKMRCEFNRSWQRKINQFNLDIHKKMKNLGLDSTKGENDAEFPECAICLLKLEPCQAVFISPCSHSWHYKCIRPLIIKSYPQFYCPNCRSMCDLETDIEDE